MDLAMGLLFLINRINFLLIMLNNGLVDPLFIIVIRCRFDFERKVWVLREKEAV